MDMLKFSGEDYIRVENVRKGPVRAKILHVKEGPFERPELVLDNDQMFTVNLTNNRILVEAFGPHSEDWCGRTIKLVLGQVTYKGVPMDSVVVEPVKPKPGRKVQREQAAAD